MLSRSVVAERAGGRPGIQPLVLAQFFILTAVVGFLLLLSSGFYHPRAATLVGPACLALLVLFIWSLWSWRRLTGRICDPYGLFLMAAVVFNGGQALLEVFHLNAYGLLGDRFPLDTVLDTLLLVILGIAALHLGALLGSGAPGQTAAGAAAAPLAGRASLDDIRRTGWVMLLIAVVPLSMTLQSSLATVMAQGYNALYQQDQVRGLDTAPQILAALFIPGALFLLAGSTRQRLSLIAAGLAIGTYTTVQLFLGARATAVLPLIAFVWLWHRCGRPLPRQLLIPAALVLLFVVFPLVGSIRQTNGASRLSSDFIFTSYFSIDNPVVGVIAEMGDTMGALANTTLLVPRSRDYDMGVGYLYALRFVTPNSWWGLQPARPTYADWLVWQVDPSFAAAGGGLGFSFLAEAYANFGAPGVPFVLLLIGLGLGRLTGLANRATDRALLAAMACVLAYCLFFARSESLTLIRPLIWYALGPYLLVQALTLIRLRQYRRSH